MFKKGWFAGKFLRAAPVGTVWWRHWDLAATELSATNLVGARSAGVLMGLTQDNRIVVGHCEAAGLDGPDVVKLIQATAAADDATYGQVGVSLPKDPGQAGKVQVRGLTLNLAGHVVRARAETGDKVTRAEPFSVQCEAGNVYLVDGPWTTEYLDELTSFPGGKRKDITDASSGAFARILDELADRGVVLDLGGMAGGELIDPTDDPDAPALVRGQDRGEPAAGDFGELDWG